MRTTQHIASSRLSYTIAFAVCAGAVSFGWYLQYVQGLEPCPLCIIQRILVIAIGLIALVGAIQAPAHWGRRVYGACLALVALLGAVVAVRHLWLQSLPPEQVPGCGPGLDYILEHLPWHRALEQIMLGSGECSEVLWRFLGLSLPAWTLLVFVGFVGFGLMQVWLPWKSAAR